MNSPASPASGVYHLSERVSRIMRLGRHALEFWYGRLLREESLVRRAIRACRPLKGIRPTEAPTFHHPEGYFLPRKLVDEWDHLASPEFSLSRDARMQWAEEWSAWLEQLRAWRCECEGLIASSWGTGGPKSQEQRLAREICDVGAETVCGEELDRPLTPTMLIGWLPRPRRVKLEVTIYEEGRDVRLVTVKPEVWATLERLAEEAVSFPYSSGKSERVSQKTKRLVKLAADLGIVLKTERIDPARKSGRGEYRVVATSHFRAVFSNQRRDPAGHLDDLLSSADFDSIQH